MYVCIMYVHNETYMCTSSTVRRVGFAKVLARVLIGSKTRGYILIIINNITLDLLNII